MFATEELNENIQELEDKRQELLAKQSRSLAWHFVIPLLMAGISTALIQLPEAFFITAGVSSFISFLIYNFAISQPFRKIKGELKSAVLKDLMAIYHPDVKFTYSATKQDVRQITKDSGLVSANRYAEEDVIQGSYGENQFYISEVKLSRKKNKSRRTVFDGLLFRIKMSGKHFPKSRMQSKPGLLTTLFGGYQEDTQYGFHYDTEDPQAFREEMGSLFPFIRHLIQKNKDVRISTEGNEIVMFLSSDMAFMDDPKPNIHDPLLSKQYTENFSRQLNSLLFIVESLSNNLNSEEIEERLELRTLELIRKTEET